MTHFLDTNTCIYFLKGQFPGIEAKLRSLNPERIKIPSIVKAELFYEIAKSERKKENLAQISEFLFPYETIPFDGAAAELYGELRARLESKGQIIGPNDLIVAATVLSRQGRLVTRDLLEFSRIEGLKTEDWTA